MNTVKRNLAIIGLLALTLAACAPGGAQQPDATSTPTPDPNQPVSSETPTAAPEATPTIGGNVVTGEAVVESVEILMLESFPVQVNVVAKGYVPDACTTISGVEQSRTDNTFSVKIGTLRPADQACAEVITPFEETIPLDVVGLKAGTYTVDVNGVTQTFEMQQDNVSP